MISLEGFSFPGVTPTTTTDELAKEHEKASPGDTDTSLGDAKKDGEEEKDWITEITDNLGLTSSSTTEAGEAKPEEEGESWVPSLNFQFTDPFAPAEGTTSANPEAAWPTFPNFWEQPPEEKAGSTEPTPATTDSSSTPWDMGGLWGSSESEPPPPPPQPIAEPTKVELQEPTIPVQHSPPNNDPEDIVVISASLPDEDVSTSELTTVSLEREDLTLHDDDVPKSESPAETSRVSSNDTEALTDQAADRPKSVAEPANDNGDVDMATPAKVTRQPVAEADSNAAEPTTPKPDSTSSTVQAERSTLADMKEKGSFFSTSMRSLMGLEAEEATAKTPVETSPSGSFFESIFGPVFEKPSQQDNHATDDEWDDFGKEDDSQHSTAEAETKSDLNEGKIIDEVANTAEHPVSAVTDWLNTFQLFVSTQVTGVVDMVVSKPRHPKFHRKRAIKKTWTFPGF